MSKENPAATLAKLRWKGFSKEERSSEMSKVSKARWNKRPKNKGKNERTLDKETIPRQND